MALVADALANKIKSANDGMDVPKDALDMFWDAVCEYVEANAQVTYAWVAMSSSVPPTPDPMITWVSKIKTVGKLSLCNLNTPDEALAAMSAQMNTAASLWQVEPPAGFSLSPMFIIPTIKLNKSGATDRDSALLSIATDIINGIKAATTATSGTHGVYTGAGTFTSIM